MSTPLVINNPGENRAAESSGTGLVLGMIIAALLLILFFVYGLPAIRNLMDTTPQTTTQLPTTNQGASAQ